jgi:hypothetical protein
MDGCVKDLSNFIFEIGVSCSSPLPRATGEKVRVPDFFQKKAQNSKSKINFADFFGYS